MKKLTHKFVEFIPDALDEGVLYISLTYGTASHRCCCGCGREVVTPLTPTDWKLIFDGETVSLYPSIGNWNFPCRSHYWIWNSCVEWAGDWSDRRISAALDEDRFQKDKYYGRAKSGDSPEPSEDEDDERFWSKLRKRWSR